MEITNSNSSQDTSIVHTTPHHHHYQRTHPVCLWHIFTHVSAVPASACSSLPSRSHLPFAFVESAQVSILLNGLSLPLCALQSLYTFCFHVPTVDTFFLINCNQPNRLHVRASANDRHMYMCDINAFQWSIIKMIIACLIAAIVFEFTCDNRLKLKRSNSFPGLDQLQI
jgi:lysylphosphatidylglycerol synthetase-like protein (DUF2156 family)